jgi:hypothetical protein
MALSEIIARLGFQLDDAALKRAQSGLSGFVGKVQQYAGVLAGSLLVRGAARFIDDLTTEADAIAKQARQLDMSGESLQRWQIAAQYAGASAQGLQVGFKTLAKRAVDADDGLKEAKDSFEKLGLEIQDASGNVRPLNELMLDTGVALGQHTNATEQAALAQELFGRSGLQLLPLFKQGEEGIKKLLGKVDEFGGGLKEILPLSEDTRDRLLEWKVATDSLKARLAVALLPTLNRSIAFVSKWIAWISKATKGTGIWKSLLATLAVISMGPLIKGLIALARAVLLPLAKFLLLWLVIDDLITFFEGGESLIGKGLDKIFGKGTANTVRKELKGLLEDLKNQDWGSAFERIDQALTQSLGVIGEELVRFVADDIPEFQRQLIANWLALGEEMKAKAAEIASAIVDGLVQGILGGQNAVTDALKTLIGMNPGGAFDQIKNWLKSRSPSGRYEDLASTLPQGMIKAFDKYQGPVMRAFNQMAGPLVTRPMSVSQVNHNNVTVRGGPASADTGRAVGRSIGKFTRINIDDAAAALIPLS